LDNILDEQKREFHKLKTKQTSLKDDNKYLKIQCKDAMRQNKMLEVALTKTKKQTDALAEFLRRNKLSKEQEEKQDFLLNIEDKENTKSLMFRKDQDCIKYDQNVIMEEKSKND
jgi:hypothetical protein